MLYRWKSILLSIASLYLNYNSNITAYRLDERPSDSLKVNGTVLSMCQTSAEQQVHIETKEQ
jgi:hypothetical protein